MKNELKRLIKEELVAVYLRNGFYEWRNEEDSDDEFRHLEKLMDEQYEELGISPQY